MEAINLTVGFASGHVTIEYNRSLSEVWEIPNKQITVSGGALRAKKATIAHKEPRKNISKQIAQKEPHTRVLDSEIKLSNIIPGSPAFVPYKRIISKGKGKGTKYINIDSNPTTIDSDMARSKRTLTKEEWLKAKAKELSTKVRAKCAAKRAKKATEDWKLVIKHKLKPCSTEGDGKTPHKQLAAKPARKNASTAAPKPKKHYAIIALHKIRRFQKSIDLLIPLLSFQRFVCEITQDFKMGLRFHSAAIWLYRRPLRAG